MTDGCDGYVRVEAYVGRFLFEIESHDNGERVEYTVNVYGARHDPDGDDRAIFCALTTRDAFMDMLKLAKIAAVPK